MQWSEGRQIILDKWWFKSAIGEVFTEDGAMIISLIKYIIELNGGEENS